MAELVNTDRPWRWPKIDGTHIKAAASLLAVAVVGAGVYIAPDIIKNNGALSISIDGEGGLELDIRSSDSFKEVFVKALQSDRPFVEAVLKSENYYRPTDLALVSKLSQMNAKQDGEEVITAYRKLLWDLEGPFRIPGTFQGADERLMDAFDDLVSNFESTRSANNLFIALWEDSLKRTGIFASRTFKADVQIIRNLPADQQASKTVYVCSGSILAGEEITIENLGDIVVVQVAKNSGLFPCVTPALSVKEMLEDGQVRIGVSPAIFSQLVDGDGIGDGQLSATFTVNIS